MSLAGKVALVTGAAQGLGKAFSEALLKRGAKVCVTDVKISQGEATVADFQRQYGSDKAMFIKCDVASADEFERTFKVLLDNFGHLDIVVNNAGILKEHDPIRTISVNLGGVMTGTNLAIKALSKEHGGRGGLIINIASVAGLTAQAYFGPAYTGTKFGVVGFTRCWAFNPHIEKMGLRFAVLCPSFTKTDILNSMDALYIDDAHKLVAQLGINPVSTVVDGFMELVDNEQCNGAVVTVTSKEGIVYHKQPLAPSKM
ncbi:hypothetical protein BaRGS_00005071 [Batillaria attramentaria]|uniref:15-hydroxyprostaglandin dehydrogenase [NAD(+)] n=1 Tax=Batillaria attramentaria TaxID=370345 RepID=A0ABD0LX37_9CAEN